MPESKYYGWRTKATGAIEGLREDYVQQTEGDDGN